MMRQSSQAKNHKFVLLKGTHTYTHLDKLMLDFKCSEEVKTWLADFIYIVFHHKMVHIVPENC